MPFTRNKPFILIENSQDGPCFIFEQPVEIVSAYCAQDVHKGLATLRAHSKAGHYHMAGWMGFEAGYALEPRLLNGVSDASLLLWFGVFSHRQELSQHEMETAWRQAWGGDSARVTAFAPRWTLEAYRERFDSIQRYLAAGDIYQANLSFAIDLEFDGHPLALYRRLRESQRVPFGAVMYTGERWFLSLSPELFFKLQEHHITLQPMKGTAPRSPLPDEDARNREHLSTDAKNRAENLMIVDLMRNDISRLANPGSVQVEGLFDVHSYPTVHQMVSTIGADLPADVSAIDVLKTVFPCGSVTGAPKIRAMEVLHALEEGPRGIYCGSIGYIEPTGDACFSVAIRTLTCLQSQKAVLGVGSAITADSDVQEEYKECLLKARFVEHALPSFDLFETLAWEEGALHMWPEHLARLQHSAAHWNFVCDPVRLEAEAAHMANIIQAPSRVRVVLSRLGTTQWSWRALPKTHLDAPFVVISPHRMMSTNPLLFHKTTQRHVYDDERRRLQAQTGCFDCLFLNEREECTEGSFTTLFIKHRGTLYTPPLACGLLPGLLRQKMLLAGAVQEKSLTLDALQNADAVFVGNSVRGLIPVSLKI